MATTTTYNVEAVELTEQEILLPLRNRSIIRSAGIYPIKTIANPEDLRHYYYELVDDHNYSYTPEPYDTPLSHSALTKTSTELPVLHGAVHWSYDEMRRMDRSMYSTSERLIDAVNNIALGEERVCFAGSAAPESVVSSIATTGTTSTAASTELDVTTIDLIHSTLTGLIGQIIDANVDPQRYPLKLVVTPDVWKVAMSALDVNDSVNGIAYIRSLLREMGGPGSEIHMSKYLGGTWAVNAGKGSLTAGSTNAVLVPVSSQFLEVVASPFEIRTDGVSPLQGQKVQFLERWVPIYKEITPIIYSGTVVVA